MISNEQNIAKVAEAWDGNQLRITFRRCFDDTMMLQWYEMTQIASSLNLNEEEDDVLWKFGSKGVYSVRSMYVVINFRGVIPTHVHAVRKIKVPPRIPLFLWLVSHNKILTRNNLAKRQVIQDHFCLFCTCFESVNHLLFSCVVARVIWDQITRITGLCVYPASYERIASLWLSELKHVVFFLNMERPEGPGYHYILPQRVQITEGTSRTT